MSSEEPPEKKKKQDPKPPSRPVLGGPEGEAMAVVADRVDPSDRAVRSAFRKRLLKIDYRLTPRPSDLKTFLEEFRIEFEEQVRNTFKELHGIKLYLSLTIGYRSTEYPEKEPWIFYLGSPAHIITIDTQISSELDSIYQEMERKNDHLVSRKTGLVIDEIHWATIFISRYTTMEGRGYQKLPQFLVETCDYQCKK